MMHLVESSKSLRKVMNYSVAGNEILSPVASFLLCDAMQALSLLSCSVRLSVRPSRSWITSKRINISTKFFHHRVATPF